MNHTKRNLDKIISETIENVIVEEVGVIKGLESFGNYIVNTFFDAIISDFRSNNPKEEFEIVLDVNQIKNTINCKNWYGIDKLDKIILKTIIDDKSSAIAYVTFDEKKPSLEPIIAINLAYGFTRVSLYMALINGYSMLKIRQEFNKLYKTSIMHELTHLIEIVKTYGKNKFPAYVWMQDYKEIADASFAFSKTEINARVTTLYYSIVSDSKMVEFIRSYNGDKTRLIEYLIEKNNGMNWLDRMRKCMKRFENAIYNGYFDDVMFVRDFILYNTQTASFGSKNVFKLKWKKTQKYFNFSYEQIFNIGTRIYKQMQQMYKEYVKKLYNAANFAIDNMKKKQTSKV